MSINNQLKTVILLGLLTAILLWIGNLIGGAQGLTIAVIFVIIFNFVSYWFSDKIVLAIYRAKPITEKENPKLYSIVKEVAKSAKIPLPKPYIINAPYANAFATGRSPKKAAVAVTKGIMNLLNEEELKGVIAHEISHIKNRDTLIQTIAATIAGIISYIASIVRYTGAFSGNRNEKSGSGLELLVLAILTPILATFIQLAISRAREYIADASGASILNSGKGLADALEKLEKQKSTIALRPTAETQTTAHLFITNPFRSEGFFHMFLTHPPTSERIRRLRSMHF
jgi:heat shock protein HtpX